MGTETSGGHEGRELKLNPEILSSIDLPGLDDIKVLVVEVQPLWCRCVESLLMHVVGSGITTVIGFTLGILYHGSAMN